ncbi:lamin tail domain-containing protein [Leptothoe sp. EHU-05/26/07-4]
MLRRILAVAVGSLIPLCSLPSFANEELTVATWNVGFLDRNVNALDLDDFLDEVDFDILLVNEIETQADLDAIKQEMGRENFHTAISTFQPGTNRGDLEVGIISRFPLTNIVEFDRSLDRAGNITERRLERVNQSGIADVGVGRGFLVAEIDELDLFVIVSHFKSSRSRSGPADFSNAEKRELVAAAVVSHTNELLTANPGHTVIFGGDVNVGVTDSDKNGTDLTDDRNDGYDDTHAILGGGLIDGLSMISLAQNVAETFVGDGSRIPFPGTGAIDVLYVAGSLADEFNPAQAASARYGSDHLAVFASTGEIPPTPPPPEGDVEITNALPNPDGADVGRETVTLRYSDQGTLDISGWSMRDLANNIFVFPDGSMLNPGDNEITLRRPTMPLNNDGDTITLFDSNEVQQGESFTYSRADVRPGQQVR